MMQKNEYPARGEKLFRALGLLDDDIVQEAEEKRTFHKKVSWKKYGMIITAAAAIVLGAVTLPGTGWWREMYGRFLPHSDGMESIPESGAGAGGSGHDGGSVFMSYAGPVFPMTLLQGEELRADREILYTFSDKEKDDLENGSVWGADISDTYVLYNESGEDKTVTALYPFSGSFRDLEQEYPQVFLEGRQEETVLYAGGYSGGYMGAWGDMGEDAGSINLKRLDSWEGYRGLLQDGGYRRQALGAGEELDQKVTVYEFTDSRADLETYPAAAQSMSFRIDPEKTQIFPYGWEGMEWDEESGQRRYSYFVPDGTANVTHSKLLIVLGDDIGEYELQGYRDGGCSRGDEIDSVTCEVERYQSDLGTVVERLLKEYLEQYMPEMTGTENGPNDGKTGYVTWKMLRDAVAGLLYQDGSLSEEVKERYAEARMEDIIGETMTADRVFYLACDLTVPAGSQLEVTVEQRKAPSYDFSCSGLDNTGIQGYDCLMKLDSSLRFEKVQAALENTQQVDIVRQNFGFDLAGGVEEVELDPQQDHYYMEIRVKE